MRPARPSSNPGGRSRRGEIGVGHAQKTQPGGSCYPAPTRQALSLGPHPADSKGDHSSPEREHRGIWDQNVS